MSRMYHQHATGRDPTCGDAALKQRKLSPKYPTAEEAARRLRRARLRTTIIVSIIVSLVVAIALT